MWNKAVCKRIVLIVLFNKTAAYLGAVNRIISRRAFNKKLRQRWRPVVSILDEHQCVYLPELKQRFITKIIKGLIKIVLILSKDVVLIYINHYNYNN